MKQYFRIGEDDRVIGILDLEDDEELVGVEGVVVENPEPYPKGWPSGPTETSILKCVDGVVVWHEQATLADLKASKNAYINESRLKANRSTFTFNGKVIACDELSRSDIDAVNGIVSVTQALPENWAGAWKTVDNSYVVISNVAAWINFYKAMVAQGTTNFAHAQTLKTQLATATTTEEVSAIKWNPTGASGNG